MMQSHHVFFYCCWYLTTVFFSLYRSQRPWSWMNRRGSRGWPTRWSSSSLPCPSRAESDRYSKRERERERQDHSLYRTSLKRSRITYLSSWDLRPRTRPGTSLHPQPDRHTTALVCNSLTSFHGGAKLRAHRLRQRPCSWSR